VETFVVRVWLPDRPGALGAVASRIGAVRGDVVGIDILGREGGRAIDEMVVQLADADLVSLLVAEIGEVDGVEIESVRPINTERNPQVDILETVSALVAAATEHEVIDKLAGGLVDYLQATWCIARVADADVDLVSLGDVPDRETVDSALSQNGAKVEPDTAIMVLEATGASLLLGRPRRPFRDRERRQLGLLVRIADVRLVELGSRAVLSWTPTGSAGD